MNTWVYLVPIRLKKKKKIHLKLVFHFLKRQLDPAAPVPANHPETE